MNTYKIVSEHGRFMHEKSIEAENMGVAVNIFTEQFDVSTIVDIIVDGESRMAYFPKYKLHSIE